MAGEAIEHPMAQSLLRAAIAGVEAAGFASVRGGLRSHDYGHAVVIAVSGDCPCGLGTSVFSRAFSRAELDASNHDVAQALQARFERLGRAHIEHDKAEGGWV